MSPAPPPPTNKGIKFPAEVLTREEARALVTAPSIRTPTGMRNRALIAVMYAAGLRLAEALELKASDIDIDNECVRVLHGKGDKARTVGIRGGGLAHLARWVDLRSTLGEKVATARHLFCTLDGKPLSPRYVRAMLNRAATRAGIDKRVHPHGLRHAFAVDLERSGAPVTTVQQMLGHTHLNTTDLYLKRISPKVHLDIVRNLEPVL